LPQQEEEEQMFGISDVCVECGVAPHSVECLFNCQSRPTQLSARPVGQPSRGHGLPQPGQLTIGEELLGYHNNNKMSSDLRSDPDPKNQWQY